MRNLNFESRFYRLLHFLPEILKFLNNHLSILNGGSWPCKNQPLLSLEYGFEIGSELLKFASKRCTEKVHKLIFDRSLTFI